MRFLEPGWLEVHQEQLNPEIFRSRVPMKILHLSDFHASHVVPYHFIGEAVDLGIAQQPDLICLTGDFISSRLKNPAKYIRIFSKLSAVAPTYACFGNHDGGAWVSRYCGGYKDLTPMKMLLAASHVHVLLNQQDVVSIGEQECEIIGLGDPWTGDFAPEKVLETTRKEQRPLIVLSHNPDNKDELVRYDWDLMLCGHTHGGQLKIPFTGGTPFAPVRDHRFVEGLHVWRNRHIHITRGVGNLHGLRFNCRPQVSILLTHLPVRSQARSAVCGVPFVSRVKLGTPQTALRA